MEMSQGNSLCSYFKQTKMLYIFFSYKIKEQQAKQVLPGGRWYQWERGGCTKGQRG
jgi:hypothetical protein